MRGGMPRSSSYPLMLGIDDATLKQLSNSSWLCGSKFGDVVVVARSRTRPSPALKTSGPEDTSHTPAPQRSLYLISRTLTEISKKHTLPVHLKYRILSARELRASNQSLIGPPEVWQLIPSSAGSLTRNMCNPQRRCLESSSPRRKRKLDLTRCY